MTSSRTVPVRNAVGNQHTKSVEVTLLPPKQRPKWFTTTAPVTYEKVAPVAAALGALVGAGLILTVIVPPVGTYMVATGLFHLLEFWTTAQFNPSKLGMASFLLTNGVEYAIAQGFAAAECVAWWYWGRTPRAGAALFMGLIAVAAGQALRTGAMAQAGASFSHFLQNERKDGHVLVRHGLYAVVRHPSYTGFYVWAIGTQILLSNYVSGVAFAVVLLRFFALRIREEERALLRFFGADYVSYREQVPSGIPLVR